MSKVLYFIVSRVGLSCDIDEDDIDVFIDKKDAENELKKYSNCNCESMCPCPCYCIEEVNINDLSDDQFKLVKKKNIELYN